MRVYCLAALGVLFGSLFATASFAAPSLERGGRPTRNRPLDSQSRARAESRIAAQDAGISLVPGISDDLSLPPDVSADSEIAQAKSLRNAFLQRLEIDDGGDPRKRRVLRGLARRLMDSPTARDFIREFVGEHARAKVFFENFPGSRAIEEQGRKTFVGNFGKTRTPTSVDPVPRVRLNEEVLNADPLFAKSYAPGWLAHELLGHALMATKARRAGQLGAFDVHEGNETMAALLGWVVTRELGGPVEIPRIDRHMRRFAKEPDRYLRALYLNTPWYAGLLSASDLARPVTTLRKRLRYVQRALRVLKDLDRGKDRRLAKIARLEQRGAAKDSLLSLRQETEDISDNFRYLESIAAHLKQEIKDYSGRKGREKARALRAAFKAPVFRFLDDSVDRLSARLRDLLQDEALPSALSFPKGQMTRREFRRRK